jgi:hypothetical protein
MSFDTLAPVYCAMEWLLAGGLLHRCRTAFLAQAAQARSALLLGEGPGRYLTELLRVNPSVQVACVDASRGMIAVAKRNLQSSGLSDRRVHFEYAGLADWNNSGPGYDLIATHFFLDCFGPEDLAVWVPKIAAAGRTGAFWVLSDFCVPLGGWRRIRARLILSLAYAFFRCATGLSARGLTPPQPYLEAAGLERLQCLRYHHDLLYAELWRL